MASRREQVLDAVQALVKAALPNADVERNRDKAKSIGPGGTVIIRDGDMGEPEVTLSPLTYTYEHRIELEIGTYASASKTAAQVLDEMMSPLADLVMADRTLGGLCEWLEAEAPTTDSIETLGAEAGRWADTGLRAIYSTPNPLT